MENYQHEKLINSFVGARILWPNWNCPGVAIHPRDQSYAILKDNKRLAYFISIFTKFIEIFLNEKSTYKGDDDDMSKKSVCKVVHIVKIK